MTANICPTTGMRFGFIGHNFIDGGILDDMLMEAQDIRYIQLKAEWMEVHRSEYGDEAESRWMDYWESDEADNNLNEYCCSGVTFSMKEMRITWFADSISVVWSPWKMACAVCSPCCPNGGDLESIEEDESTVEAFCLPMEYISEYGGERMEKYRELYEKKIERCPMVGIRSGMNRV